MALTIARSALDEARFKVRAARADVLQEGQVADMLDFCRRERIQFLIARCPVERIEVAQALEKSGFALMDTWLLYEARLDGQSNQSAPHPGIRPMRREEIEPVITVARASFTGYSGHYHADPRIDPGLADEVYVDWTRRCAMGEAADAVLVAERGGMITAFSAFRLGDEKTAALALGAVSPEHRGRGLYQELTRAGMRWAVDAGAERFQAATHLSNLAAQRTWTKLGMAPVRASYTLHRWFD